jgi:hypothetical protein
LKENESSKSFSFITGKEARREMNKNRLFKKKDEKPSRDSETYKF